MTNSLYASTGIKDPDKARAWILAEGGTIVRETNFSLRSGTMPLFHVLTGGAFWYFVPNRTHGYAWQKVRTKCSCGLPLCECSR